MLMNYRRRDSKAKCIISSNHFHIPTHAHLIFLIISTKNPCLLIFNFLRSCLVIRKFDTLRWLSVVDSNINGMRWAIQIYPKWSKGRIKKLTSTYHRHNSDAYILTKQRGINYIYFHRESACLLSVDKMRYRVLIRFSGSWRNLWSFLLDEELKASSKNDTSLKYLQHRLVNAHNSKYCRQIKNFADQKLPLSLHSHNAASKCMVNKYP